MTANWLASYEDTVLDPTLIDKNFDYLLDDQLPLGFSDSSPNVLEYANLDVDTPSPLYNSQENSPNPDWSFDPQILESYREPTEAMNASKRTRAEDRPDSHTACWESPLCPSNGDGSGPRNCKGECAPFLFEEPSYAADRIEDAAASIELESSVFATTQPRSSHTRKRPDPAPLSSPTSRQSSQKEASTENIKLKSSPKEDRGSISESVAPEKPSGRIPHHQVERKYRENVNTQFEALRKAVPTSTWQPHATCGGDIEDISSSARQPSKAIILSSATAYIKQLEKENNQLLKNIEAMENKNKGPLPSKCDDCSLMKYVMKLNIQGSN